MRYEIVQRHPEGENTPYWSYKGHSRAEDVIDRNVNNASAESLSKLCDNDAESANIHGMAGAHEALLKILLQYAGSTISDEIMREIALFGGLHELAENFVEAEIGK